MRIAYISCHNYGQYSVGYIDEETELLAFLLEKGLNIERCIWNDVNVDWKKYDLVILKSPWDYHECLEEFTAWLDVLQAMDLRLLNPVGSVRWNSDKHYLTDIANAGLNMIPSTFLEKGTTPALQPLFEQLQTDKIIIKPCVSAGAKNIISITVDQVNAMQGEIYGLLRGETYFAQPFMHEIYEGEWALMFFIGKFSHSVLKMPGGGDFRVQHYYGGNVTAAEAKASHIASAAEYVAQFGKGSLYARVDGIICNGQFHLMELELIEPFLYLDTNADAYEHFYAALVQLAGL
jgi:glutathione synthase/RimK-type ligase-like ATP-grasp enzyme